MSYLTKSEMAYTKIYNSLEIDRVFFSKIIYWAKTDYKTVHFVGLMNTAPKRFYLVPEKFSLKLLNTFSDEHSVGQDMDVFQ